MYFVRGPSTPTLVHEYSLVGPVGPSGVLYTLRAWNISLMRRSRPGYSPAVQHAREPQFQAHWPDVVVIDAATSLTESLATGGRVITGTNSRNSCTIGRLLLHSSGTTY